MLNSIESGTKSTTSELNTSTLVPVSLSSKLKPSRSLQNYILIWLDLHINESDQYYQSSISQLRSIIYSVNTFTDIDRCIDFLTDISNEKVFMILSSSFAQQLVPIIRDLSEIDSIYVFCDSLSEHEIWPKQWVKLKGVFNDIDQLCSTLKRDTRRSDYNMTAISIMRTTDSLDHNLDELDQSFMYSQLLTDILLDMNYDEHSQQTLVEFSPIWWYTRDCFIYNMLNRALRTQDIEIIINMGFFLRDVHQQVQTIHKETSIDNTAFTVYRG